MVECLECGAEMHVPDDATAGDMVACRVCGETFEVIAVDPPEIDYPDDDDDWDDEAWEDEDEWEEDDEDDELEDEGEGTAPENTTGA